MRNLLVKILKDIELEHSFKEIQYDNAYDNEHSIRFWIDFPDYGYLTQRFNQAYPYESELYGQVPYSKGAVMAELKRMEKDGLIIIKHQKGMARNDMPGEPKERYYFFDTESITLTTKASNIFEYLWSKTTENPIPIVISCFGLVISVIGLFI